MQLEGEGWAGFGFISAYWGIEMLTVLQVATLQHFLRSSTVMKYTFPRLIECKDVCLQTSAPLQAVYSTYCHWVHSVHRKLTSSVIEVHSDSLLSQKIWRRNSFFLYIKHVFKFFLCFRALAKAEVFKIKINLNCLLSMQYIDLHGFNEASDWACNRCFYRYVFFTLR